MGIQAAGEVEYMTIGVTNISPLLALVLGVLILIFPRFLNYFIAIYLIVTGILGLGIFS